MSFIVILRPLASRSLLVRNHSTDVRVRFAPSPTGNIHLGGLRTALYNYIFARQNKGRFILRIEDTDQTRIVPGSAQEIEDVLEWAGLRPDESPVLGGEYGPYLQSSRLDLYRQRAYELVDSGRAYRCFCSPERLELLRKYQMRTREKPRYDGKCRALSSAELKEKLSQSGQKYTIRFALNAGLTTFDDMIFGKRVCDLLEGDPVILKSDQFPTYHFANVVDDHVMKISHVLRGSEWIPSTAIHVQLYHAFGWTEPNFAHFPLITMSDGSKMSKRNGHSHVRSWIEAGYSPIALLNFVTNMGGGLPKDKQDSLELWDLDRIVEFFNFDQVVCHSGSVDMDKLNKYNSKYLKRTWEVSPREIIRQLSDLLRRNDIINVDESHLTTIISHFIDRVPTLESILQYDYLWKCPSLTWSVQEYSGLMLKDVLEDVIEVINTCDDLNDKHSLNCRLKEVANKNGIAWPQLMKLMRLSLTNSKVGQPIHDILRCLGKGKILEYLNKGLRYVS